MNLTFESHKFEASLNTSDLEVAAGHHLDLAILSNTNDGWLDVFKRELLALFKILLKYGRTDFLLDVAYSSSITICQSKSDIDHWERKVERIVLNVEG